MRWARSAFVGWLFVAININNEWLLSLIVTLVGGALYCIGWEIKLEASELRFPNGSSISVGNPSESERLK